MDDNIRILKELNLKYENNKDVLSLLNLFIQNELPTRLEMVYKTNKLTKQNNEEFHKNKEIFIQELLCKFNFSYVEKSNLFFSYDGNNYTTINEDDIHHAILNEISTQSPFYSVKYDIKNDIFNHIKQTMLLSSIPESVTIQKIISLYEGIFDTKDEIKYFLTVLGDNILQKNKSNIHLLTLNAVDFLKEFNRKAYFYLEADSITSFKFKYHDHNYDDICLINIPKQIKNIDTNNFYKNNLLNIIVVACYFSRRFTSSSLFLSNHATKTLHDKVNYLKINKIDTIVETFLKNYTEVSSDQFITWRNMLYLWKGFLDDNKLPSFIYTSTLKNQLSSKINYDNTDNTFKGITSKFIPRIAAFINFWQEQIYEELNEKHLEISELSLILKKHVGIYDTDTIVKLLAHYFSNILVEDNKYINGYSCALWNKKEEIDKIFSLNEIFSSPMSIYKAYCLYCQTNYEKGNFVASKNYFENYVRERYKNKIMNDIIYFC